MHIGTNLKLMWNCHCKFCMRLSCAFFSFSHRLINCNNASICAYPDIQNSVGSCNNWNILACHCRAGRRSVSVASTVTCYLVATWRPHCLFLMGRAHPPTWSTVISGRCDVGIDQILLLLRSELLLTVLPKPEGDDSCFLLGAFSFFSGVSS